MNSGDLEDANLLESEEQALEAAQAILHDEALGSCAAPFTELIRQYARLLRHVRYLIRVGDRMQQELNHVNERLQKSEEKYRSLFENASEGIFIARLDGRLLCANPAMAHILGYSAPKAFVKAYQISEQWPFLDSNDKERLFSALTEDGEVNHLQMQMLRQDGTVRWVEISARVRPPDPRHTDARVEGILSDITERRRMLEELQQLAMTDSLTGLYNRRRFLELCEQELCRASRYRLEIGLLILDADHFKVVNDTYGHAVGDEVLQLISRLCRAHVREVDVVGRIGGEEFAVLLPQTGFPAAFEIAERLRTIIAQTALPLTNDQMLRFTVSIGGCVFAARKLTVGELFKVADRALYTAKDNGRNRVTVYQEGSAPTD
ncbi:MAG: GGDEF domain-containing protein [Gammaproteobacteria bacterium]|nr:GGDEF domain-containing protein [Gammaproteobacteria bacterium]MCP5198036.1 GGDEF domain-containing protein [Gammaproteobacteria bacterium]